jgi:hypothetical protein
MELMVAKGSGFRRVAGKGFFLKGGGGGGFEGAESSGHGGIIDDVAHGQAETAKKFVVGLEADTQGVGRIGLKLCADSFELGLVNRAGVLHEQFALTEPAHKAAAEVNEKGPAKRNRPPAQNALEGGRKLGFTLFTRIKGEEGEAFGQAAGGGVEGFGHGGAGGLSSGR